MSLCWRHLYVYYSIEIVEVLRSFVIRCCMPEAGVIAECRSMSLRDPEAGVIGPVVIEAEPCEKCGGDRDVKPRISKVDMDMTQWNTGPCPYEILYRRVSLNKVQG